MHHEDRVTRRFRYTLSYTREIISRARSTLHRIAACVIDQTIPLGPSHLPCNALTFGGGATEKARVKRVS